MQSLSTWRKATSPPAYAGGDLFWILKFSSVTRQMFECLWHVGPLGPAQR